MSLLLMPVAIAINTVGGQLAAVLKLPVYLDAIGTILIAMLAGPWVGALTGLLSNSINAIFDPVFLPYALVSIVIGFVTGVLSKKRMIKGVFKVIVSSVIIAIAATIVAAPITAYMFGGVTGSGSTLITGVFLAAGQDLLRAVVTTQLITDTLDKLISVVMCYFIIKSMSTRYLTKFKLGPIYSKE
ncbi:ECF transporter S component [Cytobacillus sp. FJAT-54145]|uniref:ECF transporter S component n=1 Tax=Cytobacillus spartinae TaxID=3299023 RepID=A0ABW6K6P8_9BACI